MKYILKNITKINEPYIAERQVNGLMVAETMQMVTVVVGIENDKNDFLKHDSFPITLPELEKDEKLKENFFDDVVQNYVDKKYN